MAAEHDEDLLVDQAGGSAEPPPPPPPAAPALPPPPAFGDSPASVAAALHAASAANAPEPWTAPDLEAGAPALVRPGQAWSIVDPGPIIDGTWGSPGYRSSATRALVYRVVLGADIVVTLAMAAIMLGLPALRIAASQGSLTSGQIAAINLFVRYQTPLALIATIAVLVSLCAWISRAVENVPPLTGRKPVRSPKEAMVYWFVPLANYVVPYQIVRDLALRLRLSPDDALPRRILPWWLARTGAAIGAYVLATMGRSSDSDTYLTLYGVILVVEAAANVGLLFIVSGLVRREAAHAARLSFGPGKHAQWPDVDPAWLAAPPRYSPGPLDRTAAPSAAPRPMPTPIVSNDPLDQQPGESTQDHQERLLRALEDEATRS